MVSDLKILVEAAEAFIAGGQWQAAANAYARLGELYPLEPDVHHLHGLVLMAQQHWQAALRQIDRAIAIRPDRSAYYRSRGDVLISMGALEAAQKTYGLALEFDPRDIHAMINLGNTLIRQDQPKKALQWYQQAMAIDPSNTQAMNNIGKTMQDQGQLEPALAWYAKALTREPNYAEARFNRAVAMLAMGDYANGWAEYEWRFKRKAARRVYPHKIKSRQWDGSVYTGKHLLVHCEQGMGDVIQFCRYLPQVKALGGLLSVEVHWPLVPLLREMHAIDRVLPFDAQRPPSGEYDLHLPLLSLPRLFQTTLDTIPAQVPYLHASPSMASRWGAHIEATKALRVGLVWSGSATDPRRDCPFELMQGLMTVPGTHFFSLQKGLSQDETGKIRRIAALTHWGNRLDDFSHTAAAVENLDLIISVDTATAHLAGAMGKPVWILLPYGADWRWLADRENSPWYPTARLFRQRRKGDWGAVVQTVRSALAETASARKVSHANEKKTTGPASPVQPDISVHRNCGDQYMADGRYEDAINAYHQAIIEQPGCAENLFYLGCAYHRSNQLERAILYYEKTLTIDNRLDAAHRNMGLAFYQAGDLDRAAVCYLRSLQLRPDSVDMLISLGAIYAQTGHRPEAEICYRKALHVDPSHESARYNLGNLYLGIGDLKSAAAQYRLFLAKNPQHTKALCNLGRTQHRMGNLDEALRMYDRALSLKPNQPVVHLNRGVALLLKGQWEEGWKEYEWRLKCDDRQRIYPHRLSGSRWTGETFSGKTLLVHGEQGLGDAIQFARFLPMVKALGGRVVLETHACLMRLFDTLDGVDQCIELSSQRPPQISYDLYIPLCSLAGLFGVTPFKPEPAQPYLHAEPEKSIQWRSRLPSGGYHVGIVWAGSDTYPERSCSLKDFSLLSQLQGIHWIGLQKGPAAMQADKTHCPPEFEIANWGEDFKDFSDTAAAVANLDLVISIDTSVAHLAGAMGKPVWLLLPKVPDWRWLLQGTGTPWYPTMRLFRQEQSGDWRAMVQEIGSKLKPGGLV